MEKVTELGSDVFSKISRVAKRLENSKFDENIMNELAPDVEFVALYLQVTNIEAVFFIVFFSLNCNKDSAISLKDICEFVGIENIDGMVYDSEIRGLVAMKLLEKYFYSQSSLFAVLNARYFIPKILVKAILRNNPLPEFRMDDRLDIYEFVYEISKLLMKRHNNELDNSDFWTEVMGLERKNFKLNMIQKLFDFNVNEHERLLFYDICNNEINNFGKSLLELSFSVVYLEYHQRFQEISKFIQKKGRLFELELVEFDDEIKLDEEILYSENQLGLSNEGKKLFYENDAFLFIHPKSINCLVQDDDIVEKALFFDDDLQAELVKIQHCLTQENFMELQSALEKKSFSQGITILFHSEVSGVGRRQAVYQLLAKQTQRAFLEVDLSEFTSSFAVKNKKKLINIINNYNQISSKMLVKPILLLNDRDGFFGKQNVEQQGEVVIEKNEMQSVLVEQLKNFKGIVVLVTNNYNQIAGTSLERSFLFKVKFDLPSIEIRRKIWSHHLPSLKDSDIMRLSSPLNYTAADIENVARNATIQGLIDDNKIDLSSMITALGWN